MRDLVIPARTIRREIVALAICLLLALLVNVGAIIGYGTKWMELLTTLHLTLLLALGLYVASAVIRLFWAGVRRLSGPARSRAPGPGR